MKRCAPQPLWWLALAATLSVLLTGPAAAASLPSDLNGDGLADIVSSGPRSLMILLSDSGGVAR